MCCFQLGVKQRLFYGCLGISGQCAGSSCCKFSECQATEATWWLSEHAWHANVQVQQGNGAGEAQAADAPLPTGRLLTYADITPALKGRQAEVGVGAFQCEPQ